MKETALPLNQIIQGDCISVMNQMPSKSVDVIFADPPYNLQLTQQLQRPNLSVVDAVDDVWDRFEDNQDYDAFTRRWLKACRRVLKDNGTIWVIGTYHNIYRIGTVLMDLNYWILNDIAWVKRNPMPNFRGVRFTNAHETLLWAQKDREQRYTFNYQAMKALNDDLQMRSDWLLPICSGKERLKFDGKKVHSTQKPEALLYRVLQSSTNPGDVVLDPFFGTGTTGAVAKRLHRQWIGIEQGSMYVQAAQARIDAIIQQTYHEDVYHLPSKRALPRVPFGALLENNLLQPGQKLYFKADTNITATILANSRIQCGEHTGSIHQVCKALRPGPCNGWHTWYYRDEHGDFAVIDRLREQIRAQDTQT